LTKCDTHIHTTWSGPFQWNRENRFECIGYNGGIEKGESLQVGMIVFRVITMVVVLVMMVVLDVLVLMLMLVLMLTFDTFPQHPTSVVVFHILLKSQLLQSVSP
jgi:hypothetical protein